MAIEVFNRCEKKYIIDTRTYERLIRRLEDYMNPDAYNVDSEFYSICNIYYDTVNDALIRNSIEKPAYKEKLRVRGYGVPSLDDKVYVEIKKKYNGIVNKRRTTMTLREANDYMNKDIMPDLNKPYINKQVLKEIDYFKDFYKLVPKVYLAYDRRAYFAKDDPDFRLTFDKNIRTRRTQLSLDLGQQGEQLLKEDVYLMEVKITNSAPLWFTALMSELNIYPGSISKYGEEYKKYIRNTYKEGEIICLNQYLQQQRIAQYQLAHQC